MSRLLDEIAVIETLSEYYNLRTDVQKYALAEAISRVPSAQPDVVKCFDCKHSPLKTWLDCPMAHLPFDGNRWCWKGERDE